MRSPHFIRAAAAAAGIALPAAVCAQPPPVPVERGASTFTIFLRGQPIGTEQIAVTRSADGWSIVSSGRIGAPIDLVARRLQIRYTADWRPLELTLDATARGQTQTIHTVIEGAIAKSDLLVNGLASQRADPIDPTATLLLPSSFFAPYEALAMRLRTAAAGADIPLYNVPVAPATARVGETAIDQIQTTARVVVTRRTRLTVAIAAGVVTIDVWYDDAGRLIRLSVPSQSLEVVREDVASVSSRSVPISRTNDETIKIPASGFVLAATLSKPAVVPPGSRLPAVVLVGGSGPTDRDSMAYGIPILGEVAGALADAGYIVVRYDKRGIGQSGGRPESAGLHEYAEDARAAVKLLEQRKDVDPKRIAVIGHSEGGEVALIAASKDKKIAAVGLVATPGTTGGEIVLAQQKRMLERSTMSAEEKAAKVDLQKRIHEAVISGKGLDQFPQDVRRAVDNAEYQSLLVVDPAKIMADVKQPILIVHGELDSQVEPVNADRLEALAKKRKRVAAVDVVKVPGVNHLLVPATTGEVDEYGRLGGAHVSPAVTQALITWLKKTL